MFLMRFLSENNMLVTPKSGGDFGRQADPTILVNLPKIQATLLSSTDFFDRKDSNSS